MGKLEIYRRADDKWTWRLVAGNGEIIAVDGSQGYENENDARTMAKMVVRGDFAASVVTV